ncbi:MAG: hypothetical protein WBV71_11535, partial [Roseobacter sp.]
FKSTSSIEKNNVSSLGAMVSWATVGVAKSAAITKGNIGFIRSPVAGNIILFFQDAMAERGKVAIKAAATDLV